MSAIQIDNGYLIISADADEAAANSASRAVGPLSSPVFACPFSAEHAFKLPDLRAPLSFCSGVSFSSTALKGCNWQRLWRVFSSY